MAITVSHVKSNTIADWSGTVTVGNSTGGSTTMAASDMVRPSDWNSVHNYTEGTVGYFEPFIPANTNSSLSVPGAGTWYFDPVYIPYAIGSGQINMLGGDARGFLQGGVHSRSITGTITRYATLYNRIAFYRLGTGASTTRLETVWTANCDMFATWARSYSSGTATTHFRQSNAITLSFPAQWNSTGGVTYSSTAQSATTSTATATVTCVSTLNNNLITGALAYITGSKMMIFPFSTSLSAGHYWLAHCWSTSLSTTGTNYSTGTDWSLSQSRVHMLEFVGRAYKRLGVSVSNTSSCFEMFHGSLATTTSAPTAILGTSDIRNLLTNHRVYWNYAQSSY